MLLMALGLAIASAAAAFRLRKLKADAASEDVRLLAGGVLAFLTSVCGLGAVIALLFQPAVILEVRSWPVMGAILFIWLVVYTGGRGVYTLTGVLVDWFTDAENPMTFRQDWLLECAGALALGACLGLVVPHLDGLPEFIGRLAIGLVVGAGLSLGICLLPWFRIWRGGLQDLRSGPLTHWLEELRARRELPHFRVQVEPRESTVNAVACSSPLGNLIVVNRGLFELPEAAQRAILAHEIGHLTGPDGRVRLCVLCLSTCLYVQYNPFVTRWVYQGELLIGFLFLACFFYVFYWVWPSVLMHRAEFRADAAAARLMGDGGASMIEALHALGPDGDREASMTHPSINDRIAALRQLPND